MTCAKNIICLLLMLCGGISCAFALDTSALARLPVQHEGRIKPLGSVALHYLESFSGSDHLDDMNAQAWLAQALFDPAKAMEQPLFRIADAQTQAILNLTPRTPARYSYVEITAALSSQNALLSGLLNLPTSQLTVAQKQILELRDHAQSFGQIALTCSLFLKISVPVPEQSLRHAGLSEESPIPSAFIDYVPYFSALEKEVANIVKIKGSTLEHYRPEELQLALAMQRLTLTRDSTAGNRLLPLIPTPWPGSDAWLAPWALYHDGKGSPQATQWLALWRTLANAYQEKNDRAWETTAQELARRYTDIPGVSGVMLQLEHFYYAANLLGKSLGLYGLGFACIVGFLLRDSHSWYRAGRMMTYGGAMLHSVSLILRMVLLGRPPVSNLYESLLFVALVGVIFALYLERRLKNGLGLLAGSFCGMMLLLLSQSFGTGDTMGMLIAVLNTNFWLATHVLCVTAGYGFGLIASLFSHAHLLACVRKQPDDCTRPIARIAYASALLALACTTLGTLLGGIWADQSWGRFWGWDPKENGALLICLWLIWVVHGRISGRFGTLGTSIALSLLSIVIMISWLGVNLLNVGLHSYGFTDKSAYALAAFSLGECAIAAFFYLRLRVKHHVA